MLFEIILSFLLLANAADPVNLLLSSESLCPDCMYTFKTQIKRLYNSDARSIMKFTLLPYGNCQQYYNGSWWIFRCQHGETECYVNHIEACAINLTENVLEKWFPFIECLEEAPSPSSAIGDCIKQTNFSLTQKKLEDCANSQFGNTLMHDIGVETENLNPPHEYVPWYVVNGEHTEDLQTQCEHDLIKVICDRYQGDLPSACTNRHPFKVEKRKPGRCYPKKF